MITRSSRSAARRARSSPGFQAGARLGFAVSGLLHVLIGALAIAIAAGAGAREADQSGALRQLAATPAGIVVLWVVIVGMAAIALWEIISGVIMPRGRDHGWTRRVSSAGKAIAYGAVLVTALSVAAGSHTSSTDSSSTFTATLLSAPGGVVALVVVGLVVAGIGVFFIVNGFRQGFRRDIRIPDGVLGVVTGGLGRPPRSTRVRSSASSSSSAP